MRLFLKRGDDGEWATVTKVCWVTKVQGKHPSLSFPFPIPSFSAKAGNLEIQLAKHGPPLCSDTTGNHIQNLAHPEWVPVKIETSPFDFGLPKHFKITHPLSRALLINLANLILCV